MWLISVVTAVVETFVTGLKRGTPRAKKINVVASLRLLTRRQLSALARCRKTFAFLSSFSASSSTLFSFFFHSPFFVLIFFSVLCIPSLSLSRLSCLLYISLYFFVFFFFSTRYFPSFVFIPIMFFPFLKFCFFLFLPSFQSFIFSLFREIAASGMQSLWFPRNTRLKPLLLLSGPLVRLSSLRVIILETCE